MKAKKIFMTILVMMGFVIAKAQGYPPELALVSQPVMTYNDYDNTITLYYDVQNIGDARYKGYVYIYLDPDDGNYYARKRVNVCPGRIKRIAIDIPAYRPNPSWTYTVMPYYSLGSELYSFTTFEYFEPLAFSWYGPRTEVYYVTVIPPRPRYYTRPAEIRFYYDGYRPPMPPPMGYGPGAPMPPYHNPMHHTYSYHYNNGGYPVNHPEHYGEGYNSQATVRPHNPNTTPGSLGSRDEGNAGTNVNNGATVRPNNPGTTNNLNGNGATVRPNNSGTGTNQNGATVRPNGNANNSGNVSRPSSGSSSSSGRTGTNSGSGNVNRPSSGSSSSSGRTGTGSSSGTVNRPSSGTSSSSGRTGTSSSSGTVSRPSSGSSSSSGRTGTSSNSGNVSRPSSGSSSTGSSSRGSSSSSSSSRSSSSSSSSRGGSSSRSR